jgi:Tfp pilus assembly protein PilF
MQDPNNAAAFLNRGRAYQTVGELGRAVEDYNRAIDMDPQFADAYCQRGLRSRLAGRRC